MACDHYPLGMGSLGASATHACGNGKIETDEICDDGNTLGHDACSADCKKVLTPLPAICQSNDAPAFLVVDTQGTPIPGAIVTLYTNTTPADTALHQSFPYVPFASGDIRTIGQTNSEGKYIINPDVLVSSGNYLVSAQSKGYLSQFAANLHCGSFNTDTVATLTLQGLSNYPTTSAVAETDFYPARIDTFHYSHYERANRPIVFPYVPTVRLDQCKDLSSVDVTMHIVGAATPNEIVHPQGIPASDVDLAYHQTVTRKNVPLFQMDSFRFQLPSGVYYFYFELTLHRDATAETVMFYPERASYDTYPDITGGKAPSLDFSIAYTFDSELLVYPEDYLNGLPETKPTQLWDVTGANTPGDDKINIVILNVGFDSTTFKAVVKEMVQNKTLGFYAVAPYSGNASQFNIWAYPASLTTEDAQWPLSNSWAVLSGTSPLSKSQKVFMNEAFGQNPLMVLLMNDPTLATGTNAGSGFCQFKNGISISLSKDEFSACLQKNGNNAALCAQEFDMSRIFLHEMGHELGWLGEEYYENSGLFNITDFEKTYHHSFNPYYKPNTHFPTGMSPEPACFQSRYSYGQRPAETIFCKDISATPYCDAVPWHDLVGRGCGEEDSVDCEANDVNAFQEVGCYPGGGPDVGRSYVNLLKPQMHSVMDFNIYFLGTDPQKYNGHVYGMVNERGLCRGIKAFSGALDHGCSTLCIEGCPVGTRCTSDGQCVKK